MLMIIPLASILILKDMLSLFSFLGLVKAQDLFSTLTQWKDRSSFQESKKFDFAQKTSFGGVKNVKTIAVFIKLLS